MPRYIVLMTSYHGYYCGATMHACSGGFIALLRQPVSHSASLSPTLHERMGLAISSSTGSEASSLCSAGPAARLPSGPSCTWQAEQSRAEQIMAKYVFSSSWQPGLSTVHTSMYGHSCCSILDASPARCILVALGNGRFACLRPRPTLPARPRTYARPHARPPPPSSSSVARAHLHYHDSVSGHVPPRLAAAHGCAQAGTRGCTARTAHRQRASERVPRFSLEHGQGEAVDAAFGAGRVDRARVEAVGRDAVQHAALPATHAVGHIRVAQAALPPHVVDHLNRSGTAQHSACQSVSQSAPPPIVCSFARSSAPPRARARPSTGPAQPGAHHSTRPSTLSQPETLAQSDGQARTLHPTH